jgi:hypothetical protein
MKEKSFFSFFIFVVPNLPWLFGYASLAADSFAAITRRFREGAPVEIERLAPGQSSARRNGAAAQREEALSATAE